MTFQPNILEGKTALVTGGGTGICRGISLALAAHGCDVAITSRKLEHLEPTAREIEGLGRRAVAVPADVRDPVAVEAAVNEAAGKLGRLDILVNGAAGNFLCLAEDLSPNGFGAVVDIDIATGVVDIGRYIVIEDCGTVINPMIVTGQIHGGVAQGLGHALLEHAAYDDNGQPLATSFMDYLLPGFSEVPRMEVEHFESPSPNTLGGFKGMGEGGAINPPAAIANAVSDALAPFGISIDRTPITPTSIVEAVEAARGVAGH